MDREGENKEASLKQDQSRTQGVDRNKPNPPVSATKPSRGPFHRKR